jgi:predicted PurR-regulated permease PerM
VGAGLVIAVFIGLGTVAVLALKQPASAWLEKAPDSLEMLRTKALEAARRLDQFTHLAPWFNPPPEDPAAHAKNLIDAQSLSVAGNVVSYTTSFLTGAFEMIVLLFFLLAAGDALLEKVVRVMPRVSDKEETLNLSQDMERTISTYLFTITLINAAVGLLVALAMALVGMPNPTLWGAVAGLLNFIPYFGPFLMTMVLVLAGLLSFEDSTTRGLLPAVVYLGLHAIETNVITPEILGRRLTLSPVAIFVSIMFWTWLWGVPGALLSVPLLMTFKIVCDHVKPLSPIGEFLNG